MIFITVQSANERCFYLWKWILLQKNKNLCYGEYRPICMY